MRLATEKAARTNQREECVAEVPSSDRPDAIVCSDHDVLSGTNWSDNVEQCTGTLVAVLRLARSVLSRESERLEGRGHALAVGARVA